MSLPYPPLHVEVATPRLRLRSATDELLESVFPSLSADDRAALMAATTAVDQLTITFSEPVNVTGTPQLTLTMRMP